MSVYNDETTNLNVWTLIIYIAVSRVYSTYWTNIFLKDRAVFLCCSVLPSVCRLFGFAQTWFRFEFVVSAIWDRSIGGEGLPVPSLLLLSMAFGTYFIWMSGTFKWPIMDILWILWTLPAVIAIEGKLVFSSQRVKPHHLAGFEFETKRVISRFLFRT